MKERTSLTDKIEHYAKLKSDLEECDIMMDLAIEESDAETIDEVARSIADVQDRSRELSLKLMLDGEDDEKNAIVSINAGAGGTEAQDWAEMLFRMYARWVERKGYKLNIIDYQPGDEAGIKGVTFTATGEYAFGYMRSESGVHRLVRISPFNASGKRHTSFASVFVYPELDRSISIDIEDKDLRVDVYRASGAGGQHVNKTDSAIRLTHIPSGIVVECQDERSQHKNRARAMSLLQARLLEQEQTRQETEIAESRRLQVGSGDRSQRIRTYNFPQGRVTDHRINLTLYKLDEILTGSLDMVVDPLMQEHQADLLAEVSG